MKLRMLQILLSAALAEQGLGASGESDPNKATPESERAKGVFLCNASENPTNKQGPQEAILL